MVTERLQRVDLLGSYIHDLCGGRDTFKLQRRDQVLGTRTPGHTRPSPAASPVSDSSSSALPQGCRSVKPSTAAEFVTLRVVWWWKLRSVSCELPPPLPLPPSPHPTPPHPIGPHSTT